ncbi:Retrovirus-related Pol polyprotein from transposon TNT 1-94 [Bienertia sinuspersici]
MTFDSNLLQSKRTLHKPVRVSLPDGTYKLVNLIGYVALNSDIILRNVMFVDGFKHNLLSIDQLVKDSNIKIEFIGDVCYFQGLSEQKILAYGKRDDGLYFYQSKVPEVKIGDRYSNNATVTEHRLPNKTALSIPIRSNNNVSLDILHARLGHVSLSKMQHIPICNCQSIREYNCCVCSIAKFHKLPFETSENRAASCFDLVHMDFWGPYKVEALDGSKYFFTILDDHSRITWTSLLKNKLQVAKVIISFFQMVKTQFGKEIKCIRSDNGTEIVKEQCLDFFSKLGVIHQRSVAGVPQQNSRVERKHKHLLEVSRSLRFHAHLPKQFWGDCILSATDIVNKLPTKVLGWKTPYETLFNKPVSYDDLKIIGCLCFAYNMSKIKDKFDPRGRKCILIGFPFGQKAYKLYDLDTKQVFISRDVIFYESIFPFKNSEIDKNNIEYHNQPNIISFGEEDLVQITNNNISIDHNSTSDNSDPIANMSAHHDIVEDSTNLPGTVYQSENQDTNLGSQDQLINSATDIQQPNLFVVSDFSGTDSPGINHTDLNEFSNNLINANDTHSTSVINTKRQIKSSNSLKDYIGAYVPHRLSNDKMSESVSFAVNSSKIIEPRNYSEAKLTPGWIEAMNKELKALEDNCTWEMCDLPKGKKAINSKWVYKTKLNPDGTVERLKARLVAVGYQQVEGEDFTQTFSPVAKLATVRVVIALATVKNWPLCQLDVNNAFLHGYLEEEVYMIPPEGYEKGQKGQVCKLKKTLYGLKQASRQWNKELCKLLKFIGFKQSTQDYSLFTRSKEGEFLVVLVYVDDMLVTGTSQVQIEEVKTCLDQAFTIKDLGQLNYFLGIEVKRTNSGTFLYQKKYISDILIDSGMENCIIAAAPLPTGLKLSAYSGEPITNPNVYRRLIGRLLYLGMTRPDLAYCVQHLSQYMHCPRVPHLRAALHVLRYLKGTTDMGLFYSAESDMEIKAYSDSDWDGCQDTSRSLSAYAIFLGNNLVSWKTKKQGTVSKSSAEAEYRSMSSTASEIVWLEGLLQDLQVQAFLPIQFYCDNKSAEHLAQNPKFHDKTKHLKRDMHYIREQVKEGFIETSHVSSSQQLADLLTKPLNSTQHKLLSCKLGLQPELQLERGVLT